MMYEVSVIIPNYNGKRYLKECLDSMREQDFKDFEVVLVDNGSEDGSVSFVKEHYPEVQVIALKENTGFCGAVNVGIKASLSAYVILLNNDTIADKSFVRHLLKSMKGKTKAFSCQAKMLQMQDRGKMDDGGNYYCALAGRLQRGREDRSRNITGRRRFFLPVQAPPSTGERFWMKSDILTRRILPIWKIWISATGQGFTAMKTGSVRRQGCIMWEAVLAALGIIFLKCGILPETTSI